MSLRGTLMLKGGLNADLQNLGHNTGEQIASISHRNRDSVARSLPTVIVLWAGGGRKLSYT